MSFLKTVLTAKDQIQHATTLRSVMQNNDHLDELANFITEMITKYGEKLQAEEK